MGLERLACGCFVAQQAAEGAFKGRARGEGKPATPQTLQRLIGPQKGPFKETPCSKNTDPSSG